MLAKKKTDIEKDNRICYLLLQLGVPQGSLLKRKRKNVPVSFSILGPSRKAVVAAKNAGKALGFEVWTVPILFAKNRFGDHRFAFRLSRFKRDDVRALRFAETVLNATSILHGPLIDMSEISSLVLPVPVCLIYKKDHLIIEDLVKFEESLSWSERTLDSPANELVSAFFISDNYVETAWRITPTIFENVQLDLAVRFLNASQVDFYISPSQIEEINNNSDSIPRTGFEQSKMENALQNAFKAIESILGDPPKSDEKFFRKMEATGLDPLEEVGYIQKHQLHRVIREMNLARDKKAAHGSTSQRNITFSEMLEYQACARHVILTAIEKKLGHSIFA